MLCPPRWACLQSCLPPCLPSGLGCCVRLAGFLFLIVCGLVSGLVCHLGWDAVSASLVLLFSCLRSCLRSCLPSWLGCCVRLAGLSPVLSPSLSPIWSGMLCPPPWSCLSLVSGLVSQLLSLFCLVACLSSGMLCLPCLGLSFPCLRSCLPACLPGCCVRLLGSSPSPACLRSFAPACFPAGLVCPCSGLVSKISCAICATVWGLRWCNFCESQCQGSANMTRMTQCRKSWQAQHFVSALKSDRCYAKFIFFELCKNSFIRKIVDFESQKCQNWRKPRTKRSRSVVEKCCHGMSW